MSDLGRQAPATASSLWLPHSTHGRTQNRDQSLFDCRVGACNMVWSSRQHCRACPLARTFGQSWEIWVLRPAPALVGCAQSTHPTLRDFPAPSRAHLRVERQRSRVQGTVLGGRERGLDCQVVESGRRPWLEGGCFVL